MSDTGARRGIAALIAAFVAGVLASSRRPDSIKAPKLEPGEGKGPLDRDPEPGGTLEELQAAFDDAGVQFFKAAEVTFLPKAKPPKHHVPPREFWPNLIAVALLADKIRETVGHPIWISSGYRPPWYNEAVSGVPGGAHTRAAALDLNTPTDLRSKENVERMRMTGARLWLSDPTFAGLGIYSSPPGRLHVDVKHPGGKGHRFWKLAGQYIRKARKEKEIA